MLERNDVAKVECAPPAAQPPSIHPYAYAHKCNVWEERHCGQTTHAHHLCRDAHGGPRPLLPHSRTSKRKCSYMPTQPCYHIQPQLFAQAGNSVEGAFLVRQSGKRVGDFVLSVFLKGKPQHFVITVSTAKILI